LHFKGIPQFSPELFRYVNNLDPMRSKQLNKGLTQLMDEGVAQLFTKEDNARKVVGTVGNLQFEVIQYRLKNEYGASCQFENMQLYKACWMVGDPKEIRDFVNLRKKNVAKDKDGRFVYMAESAWMLQTVQKNYPDIAFHFTSEF